jgi:anti-sigma factor RsiW
MKDLCSSMSELLERYHDGEATEQERSRVEDHLSGCFACREIVTEMEELGNLLRAPIEEAAAAENFNRVWQNVRREIRERPRLPWWESLRFWLGVSPLLRKKVWVPALAAAMLILSFVIVPTLLRENTSPARLSAVEYVESPNHNVMIYEEEKGNVTVIWLFDGADQEAPTS